MDIAPDHSDPLAASRVLLQAVQVLHERGAHRIGVFPFLSPTGLYWRCRLTVDGTMLDSFAYTSADQWALPGNPEGDPTDAATLADRIWSLLTDDEREAARQPDPDYTGWYTNMLEALGDGLPILYDDSWGPAPYEQGHLKVIGPAGARIPGDGTIPLPPGNSLAMLLGRG